MLLRCTLCLAALALSAMLASCHQDRPQGSLAEWQRCIADATKGSKLTYPQVIRAIQPCEALLQQAAFAYTRDELGERFNPKSPKTIARFRENEQMLIEAHACAISSPRGPDCIAIM
jgi:hypothetical protein